MVEIHTIAICTALFMSCVVTMNAISDLFKTISQIAGFELFTAIVSCIFEWPSLLFCFSKCNSLNKNIHTEI